MARVLIVGCGARGRALAVRLRAGGLAVRGTSRDRGRLGEIEACGAEAVLADPDRVATLLPAFDGVSAVCLLLGSATGSRESVEALHTTRLEMILTKLIDTTVHGILYEGGGTVEPELLDRGGRLVAELCAQNRIPCHITGEALACDAAGLAWANEAVQGLLGVQA